MKIIQQAKLDYMTLSSADIYRQPPVPSAFAFVTRANVLNVHQNGPMVRKNIKSQKRSTYLHIC